MTRLLPILLLASCTSLIPPGRDASDECRANDDRFLAWHSVSLAASGAAGATGAGGVLSASLADEPGADIALAATSAAMGILATVASMLSAEYAERATSCLEETDP